MKTDPHIIEKDLCTIFSPERLRNATRETELVKRERKIDVYSSHALDLHVDRYRFRNEWWG